MFLSPIISQFFQSWRFFCNYKILAPNSNVFEILLRHNQIVYERHIRKSRIANAKTMIRFVRLFKSHRIYNDFHSARYILSIKRPRLCEHLSPAILKTARSWRLSTLRVSTVTSWNFPARRKPSCQNPKSFCIFALVPRDATSLNTVVLRVHKAS